MRTAGLALAAIVALTLTAGCDTTPPPDSDAAKKKCKQAHKRNKKGKCVRKRPPCCKPKPRPPASTPCLLNPCRVIASDTTQNPDPLPFWGSIDCVSSSRYATIPTGGDAQPTANGTPQGNTAYRRTTVFDGDDFFGERCELGRNSWQNGPVAFYREGDHKITYFSLRLPGNYPLEVNNWQGGMQIKQAQTSDGGGGVPILSLSGFSNRWLVYHSDPGPDSEDDHLWSVPAQRNIWTRWAWDIHFSQFADRGSFKAYVDLNNDGDWSDALEQSPRFAIPTMKYEVGSDSSDGLVAGQTIPSHLRMGIYHDSVIACPGGCSIEFDNVQVVEQRMARLFTTGFEVQGISPDVEFGPVSGATTGTVAISTSTVRSGAASLSVGASSWWRLDTLSMTLGRSYFIRTYARFSDATPAARMPIIQLYTNATSTATVDLGTGGSLGLYPADFGAQIGSGTTLAQDTWYRIELEVMIPAASTGTLGLYVDGVQIARSTTADVNNSVSGPQIYFSNDAATATTVFFDDLAINDDQGANQNSFPGDAKVVLLKPTSDSAVGSGWLKPGGGSTNLWTSLDSTPPIGVAHSTSAGNADRQIYNLTSTAVANYDANCTTYTAAGIGASDVVKVVQAIGSMGSSSATDTAGAIDVVSNPDQGTETSFAAFDNGVAGTWPTLWRTVRGLVVYAPSVTKGTAPVLRVGKRTATTRVAMSSFLAIYVEYTPVSGATHSQPDTIAGTDASTKLAGKALTEAPTGTDASSRRPTKPIDDLAAGTDASTRRAGKGLTETASAITDALAKLWAAKKPIADPAAGVDASVRAVTHPLADPAAGTDARTIRPGKGIADPAAGTDASTRRPGKGVADPAAATDARAISATHPLADSAAATDFCDPQLGVGGEDHEQPIDDTIAGTDASTRRPGKALADLAAAVDARATALAHPLADLAAATDATARPWTARRTLTESGQLTDNISSSGAGGTSVADGAQATDQLSILVSYVRAVSDSAAGTDARTKRPGKAQADAGAGTDQFARSFSALRSISDSAQILDAASSSGTGSHQQSISDALSASDSAASATGYARALSDAGVLDDVLARRPNLGVSELLAATDALERVTDVERALADALEITDLALALGADWDMTSDADWDKDPGADWPRHDDADWQASADADWIMVP